MNKKIGQGPQFVKNRTQIGYFSQKNCQVKGQLLDSQNMKKKFGEAPQFAKKSYPKMPIFRNMNP